MDRPGVQWNIDIMHAVMSFASCQVVSNLMKTCRTLNSEGAKYLLEDEVALRTEAQVVSFMFFLIERRNGHESIRRLSLLGKLNLHLNRPSLDVARVLTGFFKTFVPLALNFTSLHIANAEDLLTAYPPLGAAIATVKTLKVLWIGYAGVHCAQMLRELRSRLTIAAIDACEGDREGTVPEDAKNPILLLHHSHPSLQSLTGAFVSSSLEGPLYPNVTSLHLAHIDGPAIHHYIRAFPNLVSLGTWDCSSTEAEDEYWKNIREESIEYQTLHGSWQSLQDYCGTVLTLWIFGLKCRVPDLELDFDDTPDMDVARLRDVLRDACPERLSLALPYGSCLLDKAFRSAICHADTIRAFQLRVSFGAKKDERLVLADALGAIIDMLQRSSISVFKLSLRSYSSVHDETKASASEVALRNMDVDAFADALLVDIASLKEVRVYVKAYSERPREAVRRRADPDSDEVTLATFDWGRDVTWKLK